jgi:hypothetical protein
MSHFQYENEEISEHTPTLEVATLAPDDLVSGGQICAPDLIKVDLQGHGAKALEGSMKSIRAKRPIIIFSNHSEWELGGTRSLLEPLGYGAFNLKGDPMDWEDLDTASSYAEAGLLLPIARPNS